MYGFAQSLGNDTACNTACGHFQRTVDTYEQYHEYQRVYIAESLVQTLDVICVPEQQNQCAHEEQGVQERCQETACKITEGIGTIYFMDQLEQNTGEPAHECTGRYTYQEGVQGADAEQCAVPDKSWLRQRQVPATALL